MPKQKTDGGYRLPQVINPDEHICVTVRVPKDLNHIIAFWGALGELGYWWNWERDEQKRGREVAAVWRERIDEARLNTVYGDCEGGNVQVRQRPDEPCKLDVKYGGNEWEQFADISLCQQAAVNQDGTITIGNVTINPQAPLGVSAEGIPIQPPPRPIMAEDRTCVAAVNLARVLAQTHREICSKITLSPMEQALAAVGVFAAVLVYPPNILWALPLVAAISTVNTFCTAFTYEDEEDLACILKSHATQNGDVVLFDKGAIQNSLTSTSRPTMLAIAFLLNYLDESAINYAASVPAGVMPCPCPPEEFTVWVLAGASPDPAGEQAEMTRSRFWENLTFNPNTGLNRVSLRFDNVSAVQNLPSMGCRIRGFSSHSVANASTRAKFFVHYLKFERRNSAGAIINAPAQLRVWPEFGSSPQIYQGTGSVVIQNVWAAQISTNEGTNGFNNNDERWVIEFSVKTGRSPLSLRANNSLGQNFNWNRY